MKYLFSGLVLSIALVNIGCPNNNNNPGPAATVGTPTTQCLSSIPTGPNGNGYPQNYPYGYNSSCAYGYSNNPYYYSQNMWGAGMCGGGMIPVYNRLRGISCLPTGLMNGLGGYNFLAYNYMNSGWAGAYNYGAWNYNYAMVSCTASYFGCNCIPVGPYSGIGICAR